MTHDLKTLPEFFLAVVEDGKTFEVRKNDRDFKKGDTIILREFDPEANEYTGRFANCEVIYVLHGGRFGIERDFVVMSIQVHDIEFF